MNLPGSYLESGTRKNNLGGIVAVNTEHHRVENLGDPYLGSWYVDDLIPPELATAVMAEVRDSELVEPIRETASSVNQIFERMIVDFTREHDFPKLEELAAQLGSHLVHHAVHIFPSLADFQIDEAAVQIYPPDTELALGWHKDHINDKYAIISAVLAGEGEIGFTEKGPKDSIKEEDICMRALTRAGGAMFFRANGLYLRSDESDIRETHAVTRVIGPDPRFTVQFRMGINAADYQNTLVNSHRALRSERPTLLS